MNHRRAFTLIELLVAMGIMMILMGMLFVGFKYIGGSGKAGQTRVMLENLRGMLQEYNVTAGALPSSPSGTLAAPGSVMVDQPQRQGDTVALTRVVMQQLAACLGESIGDREAAHRAGDAVRTFGYTARLGKWHAILDDKPSDLAQRQPDALGLPEGLHAASGR